MKRTFNNVVKLFKLAFGSIHLSNENYEFEECEIIRVVDFISKVHIKDNG